MKIPKFNISYNNWFTRIVFSNLQDYDDRCTLTNTWLGPYFPKSPERIAKNIKKAKKKMWHRYNTINDAVLSINA